MRLAVSNIAWTSSEDVAIARLLSQLGVSKIEAAPAAFLDGGIAVATIDFAHRREWWNDRGLDVVAFQALLFGHPELQLFGSDKDRLQLYEFMEEVIERAQACGASRLVFGSPKNRLRGDLSQEDAEAIAAEFFSEMGKVAAWHDCMICLEPNAADYGCDFLTHLAETASLVRRIDSGGIGLQLDTGVLQMNGESANDVRLAADVVAHVHCSQPFLAPLTEETAAFHADVAQVLADSGYGGVVSIEMKRANDTDNRDHVRGAVQFAARAYAAVL